MTADPQLPSTGRPGPNQRTARAGQNLVDGERERVGVQPPQQSQPPARERLHAPRDPWGRTDDAISPWSSRPGSDVNLDYDYDDGLYFDCDYY